MKPVRCEHRFLRMVAVTALISSNVLAVDGFALAPGADKARFAASSPAERGGEDQVIEQTWTPQQGAPEASGFVAQTTDGFLWLGGTSGLFRFDGVSFNRFHPASGDALLSNNINSIFAPSTGGLWIGYLLGGFGFINYGHVKNYPAGDADPTGSVNSYAQDSNGGMWAGTSTGVWRLDGSTWRHFGADWAAPKEWTQLGFDRTGVLWVLVGWDWHTRKLYYLLPGSHRFQVSEPHPAIHFLVRDADQRVLTGPILPQSSSSHSGTGPLKLPAFANAKQGLALFADRNNGLWIISTKPEAPLARMRLPNPSDSPEIPTPANSEIYDLDVQLCSGNVDREGNVWFTDSRGVHQFLRVPFVSQRLGSNVSAAMAAGDDGEMWFGFVAAGKSRLYRLGSQETRELYVRGSSGWEAGYFARDKSLWFGGEGGLWHIVGGKPLPVALPKEMTGQGLYLQGMAEDGAGGLWVSFGRLGLYRLMNGRWSNSGGRQDLHRAGGVIVEFADNLRRVWFGYKKNVVALLDGNKVHVFGPEDGVRVGNVLAISGRGPDVWIGGDTGLQKFDNRRFRSIQAADEDRLLGISGIIETAEGDLWLNGIAGVFHVGRAEIAEALRNPSYRVKGEHFGNRQGLPGVPTQEAPLPTAIQGGDGRLWFSLTKGLVWLDPNHVRQKALVPPVTIQSVTADEKNYEIGSALTFPAHTSSVGIRYTAISLSNPGAVRSRVKLRETDADWHEVTTGEPVTYRNLAPGHYHFSVSASDTNGVWTDKVASLDFTILPAWYQTFWFYTLCAVTFLALLWAVYQLRVRQVRQQFAAGLEERVNERTRIARELHDTLLQSFQGAVFQFQAARKLLLRNADNAMVVVDEAIQAAVEGIAEGRSAIHDLRPEAAAQRDLSGLLNAAGHEAVGAQEPDDRSPSFSVVVEGKQLSLPPMLQNEVYRISREVIRNAFAHAVASHIEVEIRYDDDQLRVRIRDDGKGIDPKVLEEGGRPGHWGISGMRERAQRIGARLDFWSEIGAGTEVELAVPASMAYQKRRDGRRFRLFGWAGKDDQRS